MPSGRETVGTPKMGCERGKSVGGWTSEKKSKTNGMSACARAESAKYGAGDLLSSVEVPKAVLVNIDASGERSENGKARVAGE